MKTIKELTLLTLWVLISQPLLSIAQTSGNDITPNSTLSSSPVLATSTTPVIPSVTDAPAKVTKLIKIDTVVGNGTEATRGSYVDVHYTGWLYDPNAANRRGNKFDSSRDGGQPLAFQVDARNVIRGWDMGIQGMKVGGKCTLIIPSYLAYGARGTNSIPANATLIFDLELMDVR